MRAAKSPVPPASRLSIDAYQEDSHKIQDLKLRSRCTHQCDSDTASSTTSLRVATPSVTQEAAKLRSSGTSTPISRKFQHTLQLHAEDALQFKSAALSRDDSCIASGGTGRGDSPPPHSVLQNNCYELYERLNVPSLRREARRDLTTPHCMYSVDSSASRSTAFATAQSRYSPAISCCSSSVCMHSEASEAKLAAARNAVVDLLSRLTQATEERDDAVETAQREWQLAEILRQKLAEYPDRHVSRLAASGGRLPPHLRSSRIGHVSPNTSPQKPPLPNRYGTLVSPLISPSLRASGFSHMSSRRLSYDANMSAFGNSSSSRGGSSSSKRAYSNDFSSARSVLPPTRVLPDTPYDSLPFSHQLSAHQQRHMPQQWLPLPQTPLTAASGTHSRTALRRKLHFPPDAASPIASVISSCNQSPRRLKASSSPGMESTDTAFQSYTTSRVSPEAAVLDEQARGRQDAETKAADLEQQLHQADIAILQLLATSSRGRPHDSSTPLSVAGFSTSHLLARLQQFEARSGSCDYSTTSSRLPDRSPLVTIGPRIAVNHSQLQCDGSAALEAMYSAERVLRASRVACGAEPVSELSLCRPRPGSPCPCHMLGAQNRAPCQYSSSSSSNSNARSSTRFQNISRRYPAISSPEASISSSSHVRSRLAWKTVLHDALHDVATATTGLDKLRQCTSALQSPDPPRYRSRRTRTNTYQVY